MIPVQHTLDTPYMVGPVHCYSAEINDELILFDTGPPTDDAKRYLRQTLDLSRLKHVIVTHCHIDHYGLAHWLEEETGATVYLPYLDHLKIANHAERIERMSELLLEIGLPTEILNHFRDSMQDGSVFPDLPKKFQIIEESLPQHLGLDVLACPGHSQSDLVLIRGDWAITGDVMLRGIFQTPLLDVDLCTGERFRNYAAYCDSLIKLASLRDKQILPGHRESIGTVDGCLLFYVGKLLNRARQIAHFPPTMNAFEILKELFDINAIEAFICYLKISEVVFLRDFLDEPDLLADALKEIGLFSAVEAQFPKTLS